MRRQQLARLLRAACRVADDPDVLVLGSQSILGTWDEDELPAPATASMEADLAFLNDPDRAKADLVEGAIGEFSDIHSHEGIYAEGIHISTAFLPHGWRERLRTWPLQSSRPSRPWFLEPHDLCAAKLMAGRDKDREFVGALISVELVSPDTIADRLAIMPTDAPVLAVERALMFLRR